MRWTIAILLVLALVFLSAKADEVQQKNSDDNGSILDCLFENNAASCANKRIAKEIDRIEFEVVGRNSDVPMSKVIEEAGSLVADGLQAFFGPEDDDSSDEDSGVEEARKKKFSKKKKKKLLMKLLAISVLIKSKIGLLLSIFSAHFQVKFFVIAIISLFIQAARFWIDLKKSLKPSKVIYYEHAQHQHHYDHDDDHGIWGRSDESPQDLAYNAYGPERGPEQ